jgi:hypothetical protein
MMAGASQLGRRQRLRGRSSGSIMYGHAHNAAPHAGGCHESRSAQQADVEGFGGSRAVGGRLCLLGFPDPGSGPVSRRGNDDGVGAACASNNSGLGCATRLAQLGAGAAGSKCRPRQPGVGCMLPCGSASELPATCSCGQLGPRSPPSLPRGVDTHAKGWNWPGQKVDRRPQVPAGA